MQTRRTLTPADIGVAVRVARKASGLRQYEVAGADGGTCLAPLYDLLTTIAYPQLSARLAMKIGKRATLDEKDALGWESFAAEAGLGMPLVRRRIPEIGAAVESRAREVAGALEDEELDGAALSRFAEMIAGRAMRCDRSVCR